jgi:hypothetical protein
MAITTNIRQTLALLCLPIALAGCNMATGTTTSSTSRNAGDERSYTKPYEPSSSSSTATGGSGSTTDRPTATTGSGTETGSTGGR